MILPRSIHARNKFREVEFFYRTPFTINTVSLVSIEGVLISDSISSNGEKREKGGL